MLTSELTDAALPSSGQTIPDDRPGYRPFRATVARVQRLSAHFTRVTFTGADLDSFGDRGLDQRINLIFPLDGIGLSDCGWDDPQPLADGYWFARWRALPDEARNPYRVYTVRAVRPEDREVDVDFVVHGDGPAARWLAAAAPGAEIIIIGPDARSINSGIGIDWRPGNARELLLVGDETAAPAIAAILEGLPGDRAAHVIIEIPDVADALPLTHADRVSIHWVPRNGGEPGSAMLPAVREWVASRPGIAAPTPAEAPDTDPDPDALLWDVPEAPVGHGLYAWVAGEAGAVTSVRRHLVRDVGIDRGQVAFMGYWRAGKSND